MYTLRLSAEGWKFRLDPVRTGILEEFFLKDFDDSGWKEICIEKAWQEFGHMYIGVAWYRGWFVMPEKIKCDSVEIHFGGVDECAWVWINGKYAGSHDIGPVGWNVPFSLNVTNLVEWGSQNQLTVMVMNSAHAGGIWRPVEINALTLR